MRRLKTWVRYVKRGLRVLLGKDLYQGVQCKVATETHGSEYGAWVVHPDMLDANSVVYSFGVGEDISFDLALIEHYGLTVHAFDPTPKSIAWVKEQVLPERFIFHPFGIADYDGVASFNPPANSAFVSYSMVQKTTKQQAVEAPVYRLGTIMGKLGHPHIDLLKMDIEGAEYAVLQDMLNDPPHVAQILVEFHHRFSDIDVASTKEAIALLNQHGYHIFSVSATGEEYSFLRSGY